VSETGNGNGTGGAEPARRIDRRPGPALPQSTATPESTLLTCGSIALAVILGLIIWGYIYWRINPEFHEPKSKTPPPVPVAQ
jgi:hypothetical protein